MEGGKIENNSAERQVYFKLNLILLTPVFVFNVLLQFRARCTALYKMRPDILNCNCKWGEKQELILWWNGPAENAF